MPIRPGRSDRPLHPLDKAAPLTSPETNNTIPNSVASFPAIGRKRSSGILVGIPGTNCLLEVLLVLGWKTLDRGVAYAQQALVSQV